MEFRDLKQGDQFEFDRTNRGGDCGIALSTNLLHRLRGPWEKISPRRYREAGVENGLPIHVGSIKVWVERV